MARIPQTGDYRIDSNAVLNRICRHIETLTPHVANRKTALLLIEAAREIERLLREEHSETEQIR